MSGASKSLWLLLFLAAGPLLLTSCGNTADPNAATQFKPVDDDETPKPETEAVSKKPGTVRPAVKPGVERPNAKVPGENQPATETEPPSDDPALAGATGKKVRRIRSLLASMSKEPPGETQEEKIQNLLNQLQQVMTIASEVIAEEKAPDAARDEARLARFQVATLMLQSGLEKDAKQMLSQAATDLSKAADPQYATLGRVQLFKIHVMEVLQLQPADAQEVLTALDTLLEEGGDVGVITNEVVPLVTQLGRFGYAKEGAAGLAKIGDHFAGSKDPKESLIGKQMQVRALVDKLRSGEGDSAALGDQIVAKSKEILEVTGADEGGVLLMHQLAHGQQGDHPDVSGKVYDLIEETYADHKDAELADKAHHLIANGRQRMSLVGKPLAITGVLVGGDPFDWNEHQGKVVLVHFWALSSNASLQDLSNIDRLHRKYAGRGLQIVGVNLDKDVKKVEELFEAQQLPWSTVTGEDTAQRGFDHATAKACGVVAESLPFSVLIGEDGKIAAAGLQSPALDEAIVKLLPAAAEKPKAKPGAKPETPEKEPEGKTPDDESK